MKLAIGERGPGSDGWVTYDLVGADSTGFMWNITGYREVEEIRCVHALEHVERAMVLPTLLEWHRILRPGGVLTVEVPDLEYVCRFVLDGTGPDWGLAMLYGTQEDEGQFHRTGFTRQGLRDALVAGGFEEPTVEHVWSHGGQAFRARTIRG